MDNTLTRKLFDNYIRKGTYSDLEDVQSRIDYYVARQVINASEAMEYQEIAQSRVAKPAISDYVTRSEYQRLEQKVAELLAKSGETQ